MARTRKAEYRGSKRFDRSCRNHGSCDYCVNRRTYFDRRRRAAANAELRRYRIGKNTVSREG